MLKSCIRLSIFPGKSCILTSIFAGKNCNQQVDGGVYKGALYENITAGIIAKGAAAVEVKSATNRKAKSMKSLVENYGMQHGFM